MTNAGATSNAQQPGWQVRQVYALSLVCLIIGLVVGYLFRGSSSPAPAHPAQAAADAAAAPSGMSQPPSLDEMKHMADKKVEPLLAQLQTDPKNADLLNQVGKIYFSTHQFKEAADYFAKSLEVKPKDVAVRTQLASCLFYTGDVDGALRELERATTDDPHDANSLFNLGMIRWQGKKDSKGSLSAWTQLLKSNPQLDPAKKAEVEKLIAQVRQGNTAN